MLEPVTLDQLRILMAIAETGSFSAAARRLSRAQSAISHAVEGLEKTALSRVALFDRTGRARKLTEAGRILLEDAKAVVSRTEELRARARSMGQAHRAGAEPGGRRDVPDRCSIIESIRALQSAFPSLPVTLAHTEGIDAVDLRVREGTVLLGISPEIERLPNDGLERRFLTEITLVSVVAAEHPLARYPGPIPIKELERHVQLVLSERDWLVARAQGKPVSSVFRGVVSPRAWRFV